MEARRLCYFCYTRLISAPVTDHEGGFDGAGGPSQGAPASADPGASPSVVSVEIELANAPDSSVVGAAMANTGKSQRNEL